MDLTNATFELMGGMLVLLNIRQVLRDRLVRGVNWHVMAFFTSWGFWNLMYYPHLDQWLSFAAGAFLCATNVVYTALLVYFVRKEKERQS